MVVSFAVSCVLYPIIASDPLPGTTKRTPAWIVDLGFAMAVGTALGLALLLLPVVADIWRDPESWPRWRLRLWRQTGSPFASTAEKLRRSRPR
jgi:hypothetical protein